MRKNFLLLILSLFLYAGIHAQNRPAEVPQIASIERAVDFLSFEQTTLFFGRNRANGPEVSESEFANFLSQIITPAFPDGLTVLDAVGQFRLSDGQIIREKTKVLILLYPTETRRRDSRRIELIRNEYKKQFEQQSVLRVDDERPVKVSF